jgi:hypothetical protein
MSDGDDKANRAIFWSQVRDIAYLEYRHERRGLGIARLDPGFRIARAIGRAQPLGHDPSKPSLHTPVGAC